jgi:ribosomal silencing factor RsfS
MKESFVDVDGEKSKAVKDALVIADKRHGRELKAACYKIERDMENDKARALQRQQRVCIHC